MKARRGFVSNSSSTSFAVAVGPGQTKVKITVEIDLEDYAKIQIRNKTELNIYVEDVGYKPEWYDEGEHALEAGQRLLVGTFWTDSGDEVEAMLAQSGLVSCMEAVPGIDILDGEGRG